ncbi:hypothetical protein AQUCO_00900582v1 [Aquilegia coerulea]|uniref:MIF4G domain-containing protein n=1 Tax=Aquilegia coerulea TaxID=218851 RepID=A0A2G5EEC8_AQUCA|nr:hypothetical protein AQUCO_00900582v1 [Aquilegia coerulea]
MDSENKVVVEKKSRKEKRKETRLTQNQNKHKSWTEHQNKKKLKRIENQLKRKVKSENEDSERRKIAEFFSEETIEERPVLKVKKEKESLERKKSKEELKEKKENKSLKRKPKTKFEEYLEMDMNKGLVSAEEDLKLERKLAKKLKVKNGKLRGLDDEMNMLFDGMPSILESAMDEKASDDEDGAGTLKKIRKKRKVSVEEEESKNEVNVEKESVETELVEDGAAEVLPEEPCTKTPEVAENVKYIPPHLRSQMRSESHEHTQFRRRIRGLLNRLSESNVESFTEQMSTIYRSIDRSTGCQILSEEILASCSGGPRGNEQYAAVFAAFVAGMACSVGIDFGAKLIASLAKSFEDEYMKEDNLSLRNLTLLLSYLCIFGVCSSGLIYDFLNILSKRLMEIDVATIVTILQCCGMKLRGDDPSAMKDFILTVQNRAIELKSPGSAPNDQLMTNSKRMEFMLETICDIKNNKKRAKEDPAHHTRIKKWLQKLRVEDILLRGLKWNKLLDPNKKGQWWLSGDIASTADNAKEVASTIDREVLEAQKLLQLAAAQRMNTDTRRAIFCIIMSGEDYIDAFEKLLRLNLSGKQV